MGFGSNGAILRVDLTAGTTSVETFDEAFYRRYPGGKALAAYHLLRDMPAGADPLGPDNVLVLAAGLLTGAPVSTATRFNAIARSPLTGGFGESEAGGYWGPELKMAGFDAIILTGRSPEPVWIWVKDGEAEIRDASALWGQDPPTVQAAIKEAVGEKNARVLQIGRAGENLVPYAMLMNELRHYNGRTGMGAVMGSKNVRAIAVKGSRKYADLAHDPAALGEIGRRLAKSIPDHPQGWDLRTKGTPGLTDGLNAAGILPTRNFRPGLVRAGGADRLARVRGDPQRHPLLLRLCRPLQAGDGLRGRDGTASPTPTTGRSTRRSPGSARTAPSSTSSWWPGPTSCATRPGWTSSRPPAPSPSSWSAWSTGCSTWSATSAASTCGSATARRCSRRSR